MNKQQRGYTLIELMVSLLLGLMLISGFGSLFTQSQKNTTVQHSLSYMMADGRYILEVFGRELRRAGALKNKLVIGDGATSVFTSATNLFTTELGSTLGSTLDFSPGDYIKGEYNASGFGTTADQPYNINRLAFRYQLFNDNELAANGFGSNNSPCEKDILLTAGETPATEKHVVTLYFYVALDASSIPTLYCAAKRDNLTADSSFTSAPEPLISNVQKLAISYGMDTDADNAANYYVTASGVTDWQQVVSVKLSVVLRSDDNNLTKIFTTYTIDGATGSPFTATDKRMYRVSSTTIAFRNRI
ncbi:MAG: PilW family protein [Methylococcaceae bacterium]